MPNGFNAPVEKYLEAIYALLEEGVPIIQARLVEWLGYSPQAVSEMVHRLVSDGYLTMNGREVVLTDQGMKTAESIVRRHRLAERFLVDVVGLSWERAHQDAGTWEHVISEDVEARFVAILGNPGTCPHGNPIPGSGIELEPQMPMADLEQGRHLRLVRVAERVENDSASMSFLSDHGLVPGRTALLRSRAPDGTLTLDLDRSENQEPETVAVGQAISTQLYVAL